MKIDMKKLTVSAMLICLDVLFTRVLALNTPLMKVGFGFAAVAVSAMLYGPVWAMLTAALGDFLGAIIFPVGAFFPGFTVTAAVTGLIFGLCLHKKEGRFMPLAAALLNCLIVTLLANTALIAYISGSSYTVLLTARAAQFVVMFPVEALVLTGLKKSRLMKELIEKYA